MILVASQVATELGLPLYCFVMDAPEVVSSAYGIDRFTRSRLLNTFAKTMRQAERIGVAGEAMQSAYESRYGKRGFVLRQGLDYSPSIGLRMAPVGATTLRIGFAGSITAPDAFNEFLRELGRRDWKIGGREVVLRIVGSQVRMLPTGPQHIEYFGWQPVARVVELMSECDFLYLPQPFGDGERQVAEVSFPNKLCTYVPARRPILLHAPVYASLPAFFSRFPCGPQSAQLRATELCDALESAANSNTLYQRYVEAVESAFRDELNHTKLKSETSQFLRSTETP